MTNKQNYSRKITVLIDIFVVSARENGPQTHKIGFVLVISGQIEPQQDKEHEEFQGTQSTMHPVTVHV